MAQRTYILVNDTAMQTLRTDLASWRRCAGMGKPLTVVVAEHAQRRSTRQNRLLFALLREIADGVQVNDRKYDIEFWHELVKRRFVGVDEMMLPDGEIVQRGQTTTTLSVAEFSELIDRVTAWAVTELGLEIEGAAHV